MAIIFLKPKKDKMINKIWSRLKQTFKPEGIKSFKENQVKESAYDSRKLGLRKIPLNKIVGSVGRYHDFDSTFRLKE